MTQVEGSVCRCGRTVAPSRRYCPDCQRAMVPAQFDPKGVVVTFTTEEVTPEGVDAPVHLAVVKIAEGVKGKTPVRVLARMERAPKSGEKVLVESRGETLWALPR